MTEPHRKIGTREAERNWQKVHVGHWWNWDRLDALWWALVFVWGALVLIADTTSFRDDLDWWDGSGVFWIGAGSSALIGIPLRLGTRRYRSKLGWTVFWGALFLSLGLGELVSRAWHALLLVAFAGLILGGAFHRAGADAETY